MSWLSWLSVTVHRTFRIPLVFGQWVPDRRTGNRKSPTAVRAEPVAWDGDLMNAGRTKTLAENSVRNLCDPQETSWCDAVQVSGKYEYRPLLRIGKWWKLLQTLHVHSPDGSTFLHEMTSWPPTHLAYLQNNRDKFHPDRSNWKLYED